MVIYEEDQVLLQIIEIKPVKEVRGRKRVKTRVDIYYKANNNIVR